VVTRRKRSEELLDRLASASLAPEELAEIIREVSDRLAAAEGERRQLLTERAALRDMVEQLKANRHEFQRALAACERQRAEAEQAAEVLRDRAAQAAAALAQAREELAMTRAREAALAERARTRRALPDAGGYDGLRPDPLRAGTPAELIGALREFRTWAGNPSYRDMALRSGRRAGASTMCTLLCGTELPDRLVVIDAIVEGCGGTEEDRQRFATAWRKLAMPGGLPVPVPGPHLRAVHAAQETTPLTATARPGA
jgi:hypothetical protein